MIITIDGPAGAGKSSAARALAKRLGFRFLDTGAMYRVVALAALRRGLDLSDRAVLAALAHEISIDVGEDSVRLDGADVTEAIRASHVTSVIRHVADNVGVRMHLAELQRQTAQDDNYVTEGRDQGTVVFPGAECKIFLTASPEERARRRTLDLQARGESLTFEQVISRQNERDEQDRTREVGRLIAAPDAVEVCTDSMTPDQVVDRLEQIARSKQQLLTHPESYYGTREGT